MSELYSAMNVARTIIRECDVAGFRINNFILQKALFLVQVRAIKAGTLAFADQIKAWPIGPVVEDVYYYFSPHGYCDINPNVYGCDGVLFDNTMTIIRQVVDEIKDKPAWGVHLLTNRAGGAWDTTYGDGSGYNSRSYIRGNVISYEAMLELE